MVLLVGFVLMVVLIGSGFRRWFWVWVTGLCVLIWCRSLRIFDGIVLFIMIGGGFGYRFWFDLLVLDILVFG